MLFQKHLNNKLEVEKPLSDGKVTFTNNTGTDMNFANYQVSFEPRVGDFYIFGALQHPCVVYRSRP